MFNSKCQFFMLERQQIWDMHIPLLCPAAQYSWSTEENNYTIPRIVQFSVGRCCFPATRYSNSYHISQNNQLMFLLLLLVLVEVWVCYARCQQRIAAIMGLWWVSTGHFRSMWLRFVTRQLVKNTGMTWLQRPTTSTAPSANELDVVIAFRNELDEINELQAP
jgi:hypothetical protein